MTEFPRAGRVAKMGAGGGATGRWKGLVVLLRGEPDLRPPYTRLLNPHPVPFGDYLLT